MKLNVIPQVQNVTYHGGECWLNDLDVAFNPNENYDDEAYCLDIKVDGITITAKGEKGKYYAMLTLEQLGKMGKVPCCMIYDEPAFTYRSFMIDSARHMQTVDEIKAYITAAARYKFNYFHWHLCDDQGWRMESEKYPELMLKGSYRDCHGFGSPNKETYGGYYTKSQIKEIIDFCAEKFIEVIPEFDIPGHSTAAISTYPWLSCRGMQVPVETVGGIFKNILCAGKEEVYDFCYGILDEICELFPCKYVHIGGDEAPKARWCKCPECQMKIKQEGLKNEEELQGYFVNKMIEYLASKGKEVLVWNESLNSGILDKRAITCDWMDPKGKSEEYANAGGRIIVEDFYHYYLDYHYGMTPLKKTYEYNPYLEKLNERGKKGVMGVETPIWTEYIEDFDKMSFMCFPRMIAVAERGWVKPENADYPSFRVRVESERGYLKSLGINMAAQDEWDPGVDVRIKVSVDRLKSILTPASIRATLFPNKDEG